MDVKKLLNWWKKEIGTYLLSDLTRALIIEQRDKLLTSTGRNGSKENNAAHRSPATVNRYMMALGHALTIAANEWEWIEENPMRKISNLPEPRGRIRCLSDEERERLLVACKASTNPYLHTLVVLALSTGARYGELIKLRWNDIDWDQEGHLNEKRDGLLAHMIAERQASIEGRLYFKAKQAGKEPSPRIPELAEKELKAHRAHETGLAKTLSQKHTLSKDAAMHCAKDILRYKETSGNNPYNNRLLPIPKLHNRSYIVKPPKVGPLFVPASQKVQEADSLSWNGA